MINVDFGGVTTAKLIDPEVQTQWKTLDIDPCADFVYDANSGLPFPLEQNSVSNFYCSMILEYVRVENIRHVIAELYRCLTPCGIIRVVAPDFMRGVQWYLEDSPSLRNTKTPGTSHPKDYPHTRLGMLLPWFLGGRQMAFDWESLYNYLDYAGFKKITQRHCLDCSYVFRGKDLERYAKYAVYVEARKPKTEMWPK